MSLGYRSLAEFSGTALLMVVVVVAGLLIGRLGGASSMVALASGALIVGGAGYALLRMLLPVSGAHLNPAVSLFAFTRNTLSARELAAYAGAQLAGAYAGVLIAHAMLGMPLLQISHRALAGDAVRYGEVAVTTGLLLLLLLVAQRRPRALPAAAAAYLALAFALSASVSLGNPALTLARAATATFAGIAPASVPGLLLAQLGAVAISVGVLLMLPRSRTNP